MIVLIATIFKRRRTAFDGEIVQHHTGVYQEDLRPVAELGALVKDVEPLVRLSMPNVRSTTLRTDECRILDSSFAFSGRSAISSTSQR
jgi:hypothetical protein